MSLQATGTVYLTQDRPQTSVSASGTYQITLRVLDAVGARERQPWMLVYSGDAARNWWAREGHMAQAGDGLQVTLDQLRPHRVGRGWDARTHIEAHAIDIVVASKARKSEEAA